MSTRALRRRAMELVRRILPALSDRRPVLDRARLVAYAARPAPRVVRPGVYRCCSWRCVPLQKASPIRLLWKVACSVSTTSCLHAAMSASVDIACFLSVRSHARRRGSSPAALPCDRRRVRAGAPPVTWRAQAARVVADARPRVCREHRWLSWHLAILAKEAYTPKVIPTREVSLRVVRHRRRHVEQERLPATAGPLELQGGWASRPTHYRSRWTRLRGSARPEHGAARAVGGPTAGVGTPLSSCLLPFVRQLLGSMEVLYFEASRPPVNIPGAGAISEEAATLARACYENERRVGVRYLQALYARYSWLGPRRP